MLFGKLYVFEQSKKTDDSSVTFYDTGGLYRSFLITSTNDADFQVFLSEFTSAKPVYGLVVDTSCISQGPLASMEHLIERSDQVLLIPTGFDTHQLPVMYMQADDVHANLRAGVYVTQALLFSRDMPHGFIDKSLIEHSLDILRRKSFRVNRSAVAGAIDISRALWKHRNRFHIMSINAHHKEHARVRQKEEQA